MSDLETIRGILQLRAITFDETKNEAWVLIEVYGGYPGFYSRLVFRLDGALDAIQAYE